MFNKTSAPAVEPAPVVTPPADLVPLSHLELDLCRPPAVGWAAYLIERGIEVLTDDIGRLAVSRDNARTLLSEQREHESHVREMAAAQEQRFIEEDRRRRQLLPVGVPVSAIPAGLSYADVAWQTQLDAAANAYRPGRRTLMEDVFDNSGELTFHRLPSSPDEG